MPKKFANCLIKTQIEQDDRTAPKVVCRLPGWLASQTPPEGGGKKSSNILIWRLGEGQVSERRGGKKPEKVNYFSGLGMREREREREREKACLAT